MRHAFSLTWQTLTELYAKFFHALPYLIAGAVVFIGFCLVARLVNRLVTAIGRRTTLDRALLNVLAGMAQVATIILGALVAAVVIVPDFSLGNLVAGLGITSVAIGFAFKDILQNLLAGMLLLWRRPFRIGDRVEIGDFVAFVSDIDIRSTHLRTFDGQLVIVPNGDVYRNPIKVITGFRARRIEFIVGVGYSDSIEEAREVILKALRQTEGVLESPPAEALVTELAASSVNFKIRFWMDSAQSRARTLDKAATAVKLALDEASIEMPFPRRVVLFTDVTPRSEARESDGNGQRKNKTEERATS